MSFKKDICFFGMNKVGKTSIIRVIFNKMHPQDTQYIDSTVEPEMSEVEFKGFYKFNIMDFPGAYEASDIKPSEKEILMDCGAVIYVAHSRPDYIHETSKQLKEFYKLMMDLNPSASLNIFFHQSDIDFYNEDKMNESMRILMDSVESIIDPSFQNTGASKQKIAYYHTSIYDASIIESMSKVIKQLVETKFEHLGNMMNDISTACNLDKVYLFDMVTKIFFSSDFVPLDMDNFALCADMLDVYMDFSCIYGEKQDNNNDKDESLANFESYEQVIR